MLTTTSASNAKMCSALLARHASHVAPPVLLHMVDANCTLPFLVLWPMPVVGIAEALTCPTCDEFGALANACYYGADALDLAFTVTMLNPTMHNATGQQVISNARLANSYLERARRHYAPGGAGEILKFRRDSKREMTLLVGIVRTLSAIRASHLPALLALRAMLRAMLRAGAIQPRGVPLRNGNVLYFDAMQHSESDSE